MQNIIPDNLHLLLRNVAKEVKNVASKILEKEGMSGVKSYQDWLSRKIGSNVEIINTKKVKSKETIVSPSLDGMKL